MARLAAFASALPDFAVAGAALITWIDPSVLGEDYVAYLFTLMLLEFIVMHSAAFMGTVAFSDQPKRQRAMRVLGFGAFYTLFAGGFAAGADSWWPLLAFWGLTINRLAAVLFGAVPSGTEQEYTKRSWAASAMFYILGIMLTVLIPIPKLGIEPYMAGPMATNSTGAWSDSPQRVVAFAVLYFAAQGIYTMFSWRARTPRHVD